MMFIELLLLALIAGGAWWMLQRGRSQLMRAARQQLAQARLLDANGTLLFDGAQATVLHEDLAPAGSDVTGPHVVGTYLCAMPSGQRYTVRVQTAHRQAEAQVLITRES